MLLRLKIDDPDLNLALLQAYLRHADDADVRRTHLFNGRYENVYLTQDQVPELAVLVDRIQDSISRHLDTRRPRFGLWFNAMPPGAVTTRHSHDDCDELLSCVYYVRVPEDSGNLIIHDAEPPTRITPSEGELICFPPSVDHEVTKNLSDDMRLSIALNFGPGNDDD